MQFLKIIAIFGPKHARGDAVEKTIGPNHYSPAAIIIFLRRLLFGSLHRLAPHSFLADLNSCPDASFKEAPGHARGKNVFGLTNPS